MADFILTNIDDVFPGTEDDNSGDDLINGGRWQRYPRRWRR